MNYKKTFLFLILFCIGFSGNTQELSNERKLYNLQKAESQISQLPYSIEKISDEVVPEIHSARDSIAPNYPIRANILRNRDAVNTAFYNWIETFPSEYQDYINYLRLYYRERL